MLPFREECETSLGSCCPANIQRRQSRTIATKAEEKITKIQEPFSYMCQWRQYLANVRSSAWVPDRSRCWSWGRWETRLARAWEGSTWTMMSMRIGKRKVKKKNNAGLHLTVQKLMSNEERRGHLLARKNVAWVVLQSLSRLWKSFIWVQVLFLKIPFLDCSLNNIQDLPLWKSWIDW